MRNSYHLPTLFLWNVQSAWTPHCLFKKMWSPLELSPVFLKNAEFTWTPPSVESTWTAILFLKNVEFISTSTKGSSSRLCTRSSVFYPKMRSPLQLFPVFLKNVEFTWTSPSAESTWTAVLFLKNVEFVSTSGKGEFKWTLQRGNSGGLSRGGTLCELRIFQKDSGEFKQTCACCKSRVGSWYELHKGGVQVDSTEGSSLKTQWRVPKMQSLLELSSVLLKNVEFMQTPPLRSPLELPFCFYKIGSLFQLPTPLLHNVQSAWTPTVFLKMWSLHELFTVMSKNAESAWTLPCDFEFELLFCSLKKCGAQRNSPLCF